MGLVSLAGETVIRGWVLRSTSFTLLNRPPQFLTPSYNPFTMTTAQSSSIEIQPPDDDKLGRFVRESLETSPFQSFLVLAFIFILSIAATSWLMVQWLTLGPPNESVTSNSRPLCGRAGAVKAGSDDATSQSKK